MGRWRITYVHVLNHATIPPPNSSRRPTPRPRR
jgi:hypothetical protein